MKLTRIYLMMSIGLLCLVINTNGYCSSKDLPKSDNRDWETFGTSNDAAYYYDKRDITRVSDRLSVWTLIKVPEEFKKDTIEKMKKAYPKKTINYQAYGESRELLEIDCGKKQFRTKLSVMFDNRGDVLSDMRGDEDWKAIESDSLNDVLYQKVCKTEEKAWEKE